MKKSILASAISLALGVSFSVQAQTISITSMDFGNVYAVTGTMNSNGTGVMHSVQPFFYQPWTATQQSWFDTHSTTLTWSGGTSSGVFSAFTYTFTLTGTQVAAGVFFDWSAGNGIPILTIYSGCETGTCTGASLPMATPPFPGQEPGFNGISTDAFPVSGVPVPAAAWLMGAGLLGLVGVARRSKLRKYQFT